MAILDPIEEIRAARASGDPIADPAKMEKIIKAAVNAIEKAAEKSGARTVDVFMAVSNIARIMVEKTENPEWDRGTRHHYHQVFLNGLARTLKRNLSKRLAAGQG